MWRDLEVTECKLEHSVESGTYQHYRFGYALRKPGDRELFALYAISTTDVGSIPQLIVNGVVQDHVLTLYVDGQRACSTDSPLVHVEEDTIELMCLRSSVYHPLDTVELKIYSPRLGVICSSPQFHLKEWLSSVFRLQCYYVNQGQILDPIVTSRQFKKRAIEATSDEAPPSKTQETGTQA